MEIIHPIVFTVYCQIDEGFPQNGESDDADTIGIFDKKYLYGFQHIIKTQLSFAKIAFRCKTNLTGIIGFRATIISGNSFCNYDKIEIEIAFIIYYY